MTVEQMARQALRGVVTQNQRIEENHVRLSVRTGDPFQSSTPGQFVMIRAAGALSPFLGRPISIHALNRTGDDVCIDLLIRVVGHGTSVLAGLKAGDPVDLLGPLGKGFAVFPDRRRIVLVAGGIGIAPLAFLADIYSGMGKGEVICYLGARTGDLLVGLDRLRKSCSKIVLSTEDGSRGERGVITDLFGRDLNAYSDEETAVYACGPSPMLAVLQTLLRGRFVICQVSVEERMACGFGACLGCAVRMKGGDYQRVCREGPVFAIEELAFDRKG